MDARKGAYDLVIDLDLIIADLSGMPIYQAPGTWVRKAAHLRNRMLSSLSKESYAHAWFITTGQGDADRQWWIGKLKPKHVVLLDLPMGECIPRIKADTRRPEQVKKRHVAAVTEWWQAEEGMASGKSPEAGIGLDGWPK